MSVGGARLRRDVEEAGYIWPEDDQTVFFGLELETGYDLLHTSKVRFTPLVGGGFTVLAPPSGDEEEDPLPEYYENFRFFSGSVFGALQADLRLGGFSGEENEFAQGSSHGLRLRAGYRRMYFDRKNPFLAGDMVFLSVGYQLFGRMEKG
jgi:hypothetical protein